MEGGRREGRGCKKKSGEGDEDEVQTNKGQETERQTGTQTGTRGRNKNTRPDSWIRYKTSASPLPPQRKKRIDNDMSSKWSGDQKDKAH